jgi:hypothetical protein
MEAAEPDRLLRDQWRRLNNIRRLPLSGEERILLFLREHAGAAVTKDQLRYVSDPEDYARAVNDLVSRGWQIADSTEDNELRPGEYRFTDGGP